MRARILGLLNLELNYESLRGTKASLFATFESYELKNRSCFFLETIILVTAENSGEDTIVCMVLYGGLSLCGGGAYQRMFLPDSGRKSTANVAAQIEKKPEGHFRTTLNMCAYPRLIRSKGILSNMSSLFNLEPRKAFVD